MKKKIQSFLYLLPSIIFNITETLVIFLIGISLKLDIKEVLIVMLTFGIVRMVTRSGLHYKSWKECFVWSALQLLSLFLTIKTGLLIGLLSTVFTALILTKKGDINDMFMWGGNKLNGNVYDWVKFNQDNEKLKQYEENLRRTDKKKYFIFIYRYREFRSYSDISKIMDIDIQRICDEINIMSHFIEYSIRLGGD